MHLVVLSTAGFAGEIVLSYNILVSFVPALYSFLCAFSVPSQSVRPARLPRDSGFLFRQETLSGFFSFREF